ncbi:Hypothetical_protein [Hexamita inflata]|uniref:Hypothetical_protein n=1 Tax=Hexamita inflata TaxID=28002 RepID=A0AA86PG99_9EUKA|nr:Hypothetical protein HINF_LOCUS25301 [Hexamita inflata]
MIGTLEGKLSLNNCQIQLNVIDTDYTNILNFGSIGYLTQNCLSATFKNNQFVTNAQIESKDFIDQCNIAMLIGYSNCRNTSITTSSFLNSTIFGSTGVGSICGYVYNSNITISNINIFNQSLGGIYNKDSSIASAIAIVCDTTMQTNNIMVNVSKVSVNSTNTASVSGILSTIYNSSIFMSNIQVLDSYIQSYGMQQALSSGLLAFTNYSQIHISNCTYNKNTINSNCDLQEAISSGSIAIANYSNIIIQYIILSYQNITSDGTYSRAGGIIGKVYISNTTLKSIIAQQSTIQSINNKTVNIEEYSLTGGIIAHTRTQNISIIDCKLIELFIITVTCYDAVSGGIIALSRNSQITINNVNIYKISINASSQMQQSYSSGIIALFDNLGLVDTLQQVSVNNVVISQCDVTSVSEQVSWVGGVSAIIQNVSVNITNTIIQFVVIKSICNRSSFGGIFGKSLNSTSIINNIQYENNILIAQIQNYVHIGNIVGFINSSNIDIIGSIIKNTNISANSNYYSTIGGICGVISISNVSITRTKIYDIDINAIGGNHSYTGTLIGQISNDILNVINIISCHVDSISMFSSSATIYQHMIAPSNRNINTKIYINKSYSSGFSFMNNVSITNCQEFVTNNAEIGC